MKVLRSKPNPLGKVIIKAFFYILGILFKSLREKFVDAKMVERLETGAIASKTLKAMVKDSSIT